MGFVVDKGDESHYGWMDGWMDGWNGWVDGMGWGGWDGMDGVDACMTVCNVL